MNGGAIVSWTAPSSDGGSPITGYVASAHQQDCSTSGATTCTLTGLKNGHTYFARVRASNVIGTSKASPTAWFIAGQSQNCSNFTPGASLQYCRLSGKNLAGVDLAGANLTGAKVIGTNLQGADLSGANLTGTDLTNAILIDTNLSHANVTKGFFIGADLNGANLTDAVLAQTSFASANLTNANLTGSDLRDAPGPTASLGQTPRVRTGPTATVMGAPASTTTKASQARPGPSTPVGPRDRIEVA